jgi:hypothetical protein
MTGVLYRKAGGAWLTPVDSGYADENQLQVMISEFPELLPGVNPDSYVCREFYTDSGPIDNLIVNSKDGAITLVECKLARNPEVRRKIIGQIIDYAASLSSLSFDDFHQRWKDRGGVDLTSIETARGPLSLSVTTNLELAQFTLLLAVDEINEPLKQMVVYFNKKTDATTRVALIELARHSIGDNEILIPQTFGYEALKPQVDAYEQRNPWTKEEFAAWLLVNEPNSLVKFEAALRDLEAAGFIWGGTRSETPSGAICVKAGNGFRYPLVFHTFGKATVEARFVDFKNETFVDDLVSIFEDIDGINTGAIRANGYRAKPKIEVSRFDNPKITDALLALCKLVEKY